MVMVTFPLPQKSRKLSVTFSLSLSILLYSKLSQLDFEINISDKKSLRFDLSEVIFKCVKVL